MDHGMFELRDGELITMPASSMCHVLCPFQLCSEAKSARARRQYLKPLNQRPTERPNAAHSTKNAAKVSVSSAPSADKTTTIAAQRTSDRRITAPTVLRSSWLVPATIPSWYRSRSVRGV